MTMASKRKVLLADEALKSTFVLPQPEITMSTAFTPIRPDEITDNPFKLLGKDWMLITAGQAEKFNSMTASWGGLGVLWEKPVATIYVRPQRYTREFIDREDFVSLSFFDEAQRQVLSICGAVSGRDADKMALTGLHPVQDAETGATYFEEARLVLIMKKLYVHTIDPAGARNVDLAPFYPGEDYHHMYLGEIVRVLRKE